MAGTLTRRTLLAGIAAAPFAGKASAQTANSQTWPDRNVRVIVPYPPAGGADTTARILYAKLGQMLGQQFAIENRGGAGGTIGGGDRRQGRRPTAITILHDATAFSVNSARSIPICRSTTDKDFRPGHRWFRWCRIFSSSTPSVPVNWVAELIAYAKAQPDGIHHGVVRQRHAPAPLPRNVPSCRRRQDQPRALSWWRRRPAPGEIFLLERLVGGRADQGRQGEKRSRIPAKGGSRACRIFRQCRTRFPGFEGL